MIRDALLQFDNPTLPFNFVAGTYNSSNIIDLHLVSGGLPVLVSGQGARDMGIGDDPAMKLHVLVTTLFVGGTSLVVAFQGAPDNGSGLPGTWTTYLQSAAIVTASLTAGQRIIDVDIPRPPPLTSIPRFLRLTYTTIGTFTAGALISEIVLDRFDQVESPTGFLSGYAPGIAIIN
jgi:hypothetical protein